ncbi:alanine--tRNA ligase [Candidatus Microgenomates bacterium]|nr:alanine--tRNA ligase [Candidatus Microgenomates bacterium]
MNVQAQELRQKFINFFKNHPDLPHQEIPSASLVPSGEEQLVGKEKVLFTSAGMQPLIPYLTGQKEPPSKRLVDVQKCLRTDDIEEVGDEVHHTFFEMLGNWSIGDYWKKEAIRLSFEFLTKELEIPIEKLAVTVFAGDEIASKDEESAEVWKSLGIAEDRIFYFGKSHNWWPTARGEQDSGEYKNPSGPCGPDTEMFYWTGEGKPEGKPNEDSRWVEIWNDVFMQFNRKEDGTLEDLPQRNVDTGMGLERTLAVLNGKKSDYETDLFKPIITEIKKSKNNYSERSQRIIADHLKAAVFVLAENVEPISRDSRGSVAKRLITNAITQENKQLEQKLVNEIISQINLIYQGQYPELKGNTAYNKIQDVIIQIYGVSESEDIQILKDIFKEIDSGATKNDLIVEYPELKDSLGFPSAPISGPTLSGTASYYFHQSKGLPEPVIFGTAQEMGINIVKFNEGYKIALNKHREASKIEKGMFKGGLADQSETVTKYHTATHLLHTALRQILGEHVQQKGSNITSERLRFDFSHPQALSEEEIKKVEELVNKEIKENLPVIMEIMNYDEAIESGALAFFGEKYGEKVKVYSIGSFSREVCGGPHVDFTGSLGRFKITREQSVGSGVRRIYAGLT